ncbi:MAG: sodium:proton antiporter, partial [Pseudomonadota bacterium]|nr:sodium:proton antiporter [Pseudomonadota bacterium]
MSLAFIDILEILNLLLVLFTLAWVLSRSLVLPVSVILIILGIGVAQLAYFESLVPLQQQEWFAQMVLFLVLPTIIFNAALKLDVRQLQLTLIPLIILTLGSLVITVTLMGLGLRLMQVDLAFALLLGAILTATDISGVLALYQRFSVSKRLTLLLEGESLFNNVAAIVATKLLFSMVLVGHFPIFTLWKEAQIFLWELAGGFVVGWFMALVLGYFLKYYRKEAFVEISLTLVLVYGSFLLAEYTLQVSGIMATVAAGITMTTWGRQTISPPVAEYLTQFWDYLSRVSQALIFFLAGFSVNIALLGSTFGIIALVIGILWGARAVILYGLLPLIQRLPYQKSMPWRYRTLLYWGSLRGAIVLALVFSLGEFAQAATLLTVVTAVVVFSALVQGLTLMPLAQRLGLSQEKLIEQLSRAEGTLTAQHRAIERIPEFQQGGLFSARIADQQYQRCEHNIHSTQQQLALLRRQADVDHEQRLLFIKVFALEKVLYHQMFIKGHLSESAYHNLVYSIELQTEAMRHEGQLPRFTLHFRGRYWLWRLVLRLLVLLPRGRRWA